MESNSQGFGSLTHCIPQRDERQPYNEKLPAIRFAYLLYCKRISAIR